MMALATWFKERWNGRNLWRILTVAAIVFAAGISGSWLGEQMREPLPPWWGWFGASIAGFAVFGGVTLAVKGDPMGRWIIAAGGIADVALSIAYFGEAHAWYYALPLGIYPTAVAVLGGVVEGRAQVSEWQVEQDAEVRAWERKRQEKQDDWEHEQQERREERLAEERRRRMELNAQITQSVRLAEMQARTMPARMETVNDSDASSYILVEGGGGRRGGGGTLMRYSSGFNS